MVEQRRAMVHLRRLTVLRKVDHGSFASARHLAARSHAAAAPNSVTVRFFQPLQLHLEPSDLLEEFGRLGLILSLAARDAVGEEALGPLSRAIFQLLTR